MKKFFIALVAILVLGLLAIPVLDRGYLWPYQDAGNIKGTGLATAVVQEREALIKLANLRLPELLLAFNRISILYFQMMKISNKIK